MIYQAYHTLEYLPDNCYVRPSYSRKVISTSYSLDQVPSRSQVFYQQNQQVQPNNYHISAFYLSQPLTQFNIQPSPNPTPINTQCQPTQQTNATGLQQSTVYFQPLKN
ncbi:unnamed protein product [Brachionus calyciflorus]|uniref:Uncharacterized protein n=1 Tax=Brachionus calyciflorus TaxID=104777 RepID=A0A814KBF9_9BILA|nr:unnamed protein product [Brachionus calyciflorus]